MLTIKDETFAGTFPFHPHYYDVEGYAMHFVDEGSGEPLVMLHGDPTWGYLYRHFIPALSARHRCIVPDHLGMGKSDVPEDSSFYRLEQRIAQLEALLLHLDLRTVTLIAHDWGGPVGLGFATRHPERIKRLVLMNTWAFAPWPGESFPRLLELIRSPRGEAFVLQKNGYLEPALIGTTLHSETLTEPVLQAYRAPFPTPASRAAMLWWSRDIPVSESDVSYAAMKQIESALPLFSQSPVLLLWGMQDPVVTPAVLRRWQRLYPQARSYEIEDASHFLQEDAHERMVPWIEEFIQATV